MTIRFNIPLKPRGLLLFCWQKSKQKTMSAVSALLKIGYTSLKIRNLSPFHYAFEQTDFLRFVPPIFLTLTSQGDNQGIANAMDKKTNTSSRDSVINIASINTHFSAVPQKPIVGLIGQKKEN